MAVRAYILIEVVAGKADDVLHGIRDLREAKEADTVTGPYDIIALVETDDVDALGTLIRQRIQSISGVNRTLTCVSVS